MDLVVWTVPEGQMTSAVMCALSDYHTLTVMTGTAGVLRPPPASPRGEAPKAAGS